MKYDKQNPLNVFTSFSGYDSQCMSLDRLKQNFNDFDYELVGWSEIDKYAIQAHDAVYPQYADRNFGDISKIDWKQVPDFDLFTYSSPCQDFSQAGKQAGGTKGSGTRSSLLWECEKAIIEKRPKYLLMENVSALVSSKFVRLFNAWQATLESYGYKNFAKVLNAKDFQVPQNRERIFLLSIRDDGDEPKFNFPKEMKLEKRLKDILETEVDEKYYLSQQVIDSFEARKERNAAKGNGLGWNPTTGDVVANAILTGSLRPTDNFIEEPTIVEMRGRDPQVMTQKRTEYGKAIRKQYEAGEVQEQRKNIQQLEPRTDGVSNTLTSVQKDNLVIEPCLSPIGNLYEGNPQAGRIYDPVGISPTLDDMSSGGLKEPKIIEPINTDEEGNAATLTAGYYKYGSKTLLGDTFGTSGTAVKEIKQITNNEQTRVFTEINETNTREVLRILWQEVGTQTFLEKMGRLGSFQKTQILQQRMYEESICDKGCEQPRERPCTSLCEENSLYDRGEREEMRNVWKDKWADRCSSQGWEFQQQFIREFNDCLSELPSETPQTEECLRYLRESEQDMPWLLQQTLSTLEEVRKSISGERNNYTRIRIRKLSERECFRLMDVPEEYIDIIQQSGVSRSQQYKMAGNSIVVSCLYHIFRKAFIETENENSQLTLF